MGSAGVSSARFFFPVTGLSGNEEEEEDNSEEEEY